MNFDPGKFRGPDTWNLTRYCVSGIRERVNQQAQALMTRWIVREQ